MNLELFFHNIIKDDKLHARWLNSLSYLEYRGFRKIARSQKTEDIEFETLKHIQEEVGHALLLKRLAIKIGGKEFSFYTEETMLSEESFKNYFYNLDLRISELKSGNNYHAITFAIEVRALNIYKMYEKALKENKSDISIQSIINDEEQHLTIFSSIFSSCINSQLKKIEEKCVQDLWENIEL